MSVSVPVTWHSCLGLHVLVLSQVRPLPVYLEVVSLSGSYGNECYHFEKVEAHECPWLLPGPVSWRSSFGSSGCGWACSNVTSVHTGGSGLTDPYSSALAWCSVVKTDRRQELTLAFYSHSWPFPFVRK